MLVVNRLLRGSLLNPRIDGFSMRIISAVILIIPTIGDRLFLLRGLIPGVPVGSWVFGHAIRCAAGKVWPAVSAGQ